MGRFLRPITENNTKRDGNVGPDRIGDKGWLVTEMKWNWENHSYLQRLHTNALPAEFVRC